MAVVTTTIVLMVMVMISCAMSDNDKKAVHCEKKRDAEVNYAFDGDFKVQISSLNFRDKEIPLLFIMIMIIKVASW